MARKLGLVIGLSLSAWAWQAAQAAETLPPASQWIPANAVLVVEMSRPEVFLGPLLEEEVATAVEKVPIYQQQIAKPGADQFFAVIKFLETTLETDWRTGLGKLSGGGITLAVGPGENVLLMVDAEDERLLQRLHEILLKFAQSDAKKKGHPERVATDEYRGVTTWTFNGTEAHAMIGRRLIVANRAEGLQGVLDLRAETEGKSLASASGYQAARRAVGTDAPAMAYADLKTLKHIPQIAEALKLDRSNPLAALLLAGVTEAARASTWLALGLDVEDDTLVLRALLDGKRSDATGPAAFALPSKSGEGVLPNLSVPRRIAALSFHRDLHRFYAAKDDLFPDRTSGLIFFENMMGIFFSGRDLTDEVLARTRPEVRFVVAEQEYDPAIGTPGTQLPAFAVILRLRHATEFDIVFEEAWQKAVGLISFTRGQQAQSGLIIDRVVQGDTKFTLAYFSSAEVEDKANLPQRFNFRPAVAMPGDYVVLSSTEGLARDLIDALERETAGNVRPTTGVDSLIELDGGQLASILQANRQAMVRNNMVEDGNTLEEAKTSIDALFTAVEAIERIKLIVGSHEGITQARLDVKLTLP